MNWFRSWRTGSLIVDRIVTSPVSRWTWGSSSQGEYSGVLREYRPLDNETAREMLNGRYLLASKLVDTKGVSPFASIIGHQPWHNELHGFSWLRHFREARNVEEKEFARTLVLDWIGRNSDYDPLTWGLALSSRRLMNWLRHLNMLFEGASLEQIKTISMSIDKQVQAAKVRGPYAVERIEELMATILLVSVALCDGSDMDVLETKTQILCKMLDWQCDEDGFYRTRDAGQQLQLLEELVSLRLTLSQRSAELARHLGTIVEKMLLALDSVTLTTGEPVYFNGCGQLPTELIFAVQNHGAQRHKGNVLVSGYGVIESENSVVVLDGGQVPLSPYARNSHASGLAFEFAQGRDLIVGSCGPAPEELSDSKDLFRQSAAHSGPSIDDNSTARFSGGGVLSSLGDFDFIEVGEDEPEILARISAFRAKYGVDIERRVTLLTGGDTLVGQDRTVGVDGRKSYTGTFMQRFHLAPGAKASFSPGGEMIKIDLQSGAVWTFLWEGAVAKVEPSVRQSAYLGYYNTQQIVVECEVDPETEVSWIFTRQ